MKSIDDTNFPDSIRENVPEPWREVVLAWVKMRLNGFIPSVYLDHDFVQWVAGSDPSFLNSVNPSYAFFRLLPPELARSFGPGDAVSIFFDTASEAVLFLGEGQWDLKGLGKEEETDEEPIADITAASPQRRLFIGLWPGFEDLHL